MGRVSKIMKTEILTASLCVIEDVKSASLIRVTPTEIIPDFVGFGSPHVIQDKPEEIVIQPQINGRDMSIVHFIFQGVYQWQLAFRMTGVNGVGWKGAANLLWSSPWEELYPTLLEGDSNKISRLPKFGTKTGKKIVEELFGKPEKSKPVNEEAVEALKALGYSAAEAKNRVKKSMDGNPGASTEELVSLSL